MSGRAGDARGIGDPFADMACAPCQATIDASDIVRVVPGSFVLYAGPLACMRFSVVGSVVPGNDRRAAYLVLTENDIVLGRTEDCIAKAVDELFEIRRVEPRVLLVLLACDSILLGVDGEAIARRLEAEHPPMAARVIMGGGLVPNSARSFALALRDACEGLVDPALLDGLIEAAS